MTQQSGPQRTYFDDKFFINLVMSILGLTLLACIGIVYNQGQQTQAQLTAHIIDAANQKPLYVRKDDLSEINARLQRIEDKLDNKVDKVR